jgi:hypothetical protein
LTPAWGRKIVDIIQSPVDIIQSPGLPFRLGRAVPVVTIP